MFDKSYKQKEFCKILLKVFDDKYFKDISEIFCYFTVFMDDKTITFTIQEHIKIKFDYYLLSRIRNKNPILEITDKCFIINPEKR